MADDRDVKVNVESCIGLGTIAAAILSWTTWHSIPWAILHALLGWLYVIYWMVTWW